MPCLDLLLLSELYTVEGVILSCDVPLPPPPLELLLCVVYNVVLVLGRLEDMVVLERADGALICQSEMRSKL